MHGTSTFGTGDALGAPLDPHALRQRNLDIRGGRTARFGARVGARL